MAGAVSRALRHRPAAIQWLVFNAYILPVLMYASPIWSPSSVGEKKILEKIIRRFTKKLPGLSSQTYSQRLGFLHSMSLENRRLFTDLVYVYKFTHGLLDCAAKDVGLDIAKISQEDLVCDCINYDHLMPSRLLCSNFVLLESGMHYLWQ